MHESLTLQFPEVDLQLYFYYNGETSTALYIQNIQKFISRMNEKSYKYLFTYCAKEICHMT